MQRKVICSLLCHLSANSYWTNSQRSKSFQKTGSSSSDKLVEEEDQGGEKKRKGGETLALEIPLSESGLGVSVKGKTEPSSQATPSLGIQDLGIFIKSVITGGAASKVLRLVLFPV